MRMVSFSCPLPVRPRLCLPVVKAAKRNGVKSSTSDTINPEWLERTYHDASFMPPEHLGSVQVAELPGRGRGVVAAANLQPGQLVLVSKPLAYVTCPIGSIPPPEELVDAITGTNYSPEELHALNSLFSGVEEDEQACDGSELDDLRLFGIIGCNAFGEEFADFPTCTTRRAAPSATVATTSAACRTAPDADLQQPHQVGHLGLFPSFSMLNHSCLPNAVNFVVGDRMLVVAARSIDQGSEVLINYLGRASLRPVDERQAQLAEGYHFSCDCPRCCTELLYGCTSTGEAGELPGACHGSPLAETLRDILTRCDERNAELDALGRAAAAVADGDVGGGSGDATPTSSTMASLDRLLQHVRQDIRQLDELIERTVSSPWPTPSVPSSPAGMGARPVADAAGGAAAAPEPEAAAAACGPDVQARWQWLRASAYDLYSQHAALAEALGLWGEAAAAVGRQVGVCEAVAPGSDLHMYLAVKRALLAEQRGSEQAAEAAAGAELGAAAAAEWRRCGAVLRGRYGAALSEATVAALLRGAVYGMSQVRV